MRLLERYLSYEAGVNIDLSGALDIGYKTYLHEAELVQDVQILHKFRITLLRI